MTPATTETMVLPTPPTITTASTETITPSTSTKATGFILPSPFTSTLFWPDTPKTFLKGKQEKIPSVAMSDK